MLISTTLARSTDRLEGLSENIILNFASRKPLVLTRKAMDTTFFSLSTLSKKEDFFPLYIF